MYEICSKLTIETVEQRQSRLLTKFVIVNFIVIYCSGVSIVNFEQVHVRWDRCQMLESIETKVNNDVKLDNHLMLSGEKVIRT